MGEIIEVCGSVAKPTQNTKIPGYNWQHQKGKRMKAKMYGI